MTKFPNKTPEKGRSTTSNRVAREMSAHNVDDVLARSFATKAFFSHVSGCPSNQRMDADIKAQLANVSRSWILDVGCGFGDQCIELVQRGAHTIGIDISSVYVKKAVAAAQKAALPPDQYAFLVMDAHNLTFADNTFDIIVGRGILHHLDVHRALTEIHRVLKPGGRALFVEPLADNPLLRLFRVLTPRARTMDESPLSRKDIRAISKSWLAESSYYGLLCSPAAVLTSLLLRPYPNNFLLRWADNIERSIANIETLKPLNQYVLLNLVKTQSVADRGAC